MSVELKQIKLLLSSPDRTNQDLALTLIEGLNLDIETDLPDHYATYQFLSNNSQFTKKGLTDTIEILEELQSTTGLWYANRKIERKLIDFQLPNLEFLSLSSNRFSGSLLDFTGLPNLYELSLDNNLLIGEIPNFSNLPNLELLYLYNNKLTGNIPNFTQSPKLDEMNLSHNQLYGVIPEFEYLPELKCLDLSFNPLEGDLSETLKSRLEDYWI